MIVCLSPHLDDAVLSCGASLWEASQAGQEVRIVNIFTASTERLYRPHPLHFRAVALKAERLQEEQTAMQLLGAQSYALDFLDAPFRQARYRSYRHLMGPLDKQEDHLITLITARIRGLLQVWQPHQVLAPLAIGCHIDHQITHVVGQRLAPDYPLAYYEDIPYSLVPHALWRRAPQLAVTPSWPQLKSTYQHYFANHHPVYSRLPHWQKILARWGMSQWLKYHYHQAKEVILPIHKAVVKSTSLQALEKKTAAIAAYRSQFTRMFLSLEHCQNQLQAYAQSFSDEAAYAERIWLSSHFREVC